MKLLIIPITTFLFCSCLRIPAATVTQARQTDFKSISEKLLAGKYTNDSLLRLKSDSLADTGLRTQLKKIGVGLVIISQKDSVICYEQSNKMLSIRLYRWEKFSIFRYDYAATPRNFKERKDELSTATKQINERLWVFSEKEPGIR